MKKLLIIVDYQNDFVNGSLGFEGAELLDDVICEKVKKAKAEGATVIFTMDTHGPDYMSLQEGRKLPVLHCQNGTEGWKLYGKTGKECDASCITVAKHAFGSYDLAELVLHTGNWDEIEICGLVSYICVMADAAIVKTVQPEAEITIDAKAVGGADKKLCEEVLDVMEAMQFNVINR